MKLPIVIAALSTALAFAAPAAANHCSDGPPAEAATAVDVPASPAGPATTLYVAQDGSGVYQESNGHAGLQTTPGTCTQKNSGRPVPYAADTGVVVLP